MKYIEALPKIKRQSFPIYVISGTEDYLRRESWKAILEKYNIDSQDDSIINLESTASVAQAIMTLESAPFFSEKNIVVIHDWKALQQKSEVEAFTKFIPQLPEFSICILITSQKVDKRSKFIKKVSEIGLLIECEHLPSYQADKWLEARSKEMGISFTPEALGYFIEIIKSMEKVELGFINQELEKLSLLHTNTKLISLQDLEVNLSTMPEVSSFRLWELLCDHQIIAALELFTIQKASGIHPLRLNALLHRQIRQLIQIQELIDRQLPLKTIASELKIHPFICEKIVKQAKGFSNKRLQYMLQQVGIIDYRIKSGSYNDSDIEKLFLLFRK